MAQDNARASELTRPAVGQGEHAIERAVGGIAEVCFGRGRSAPTSSDRGCSRVVDTVDPTLPVRGEDASMRQSVIDAGVEMADRLVQAQYVSCAASCTPPVPW